MPGKLQWCNHATTLKRNVIITLTGSIADTAGYYISHFLLKTRSERSSHTPGGSHQRLKHFQRKDKIVKDFIILNQVVTEKTLMKNVHMCYIRVTEGKIENLKKEGKMRISTLVFIYTIHFSYLKVHK